MHRTIEYIQLSFTHYTCYPCAKNLTINNSNIVNIYSDSINYPIRAAKYIPRFDFRIV